MKILDDYHFHKMLGYQQSCHVAKMDFFQSDERIFKIFILTEQCFQVILGIFANYIILLRKAAVENNTSV